MAGKSAVGKSGAGKAGGRPIIIRREEIIEGGHHGGAWKVAYADFVTAMMAFFLLMWLINATTEAQRRGIAAYFSPLADVENGFSSSGIIPGGAVPFSDGAQLVNQGPARLATLAAHSDASKTDNDGDLNYGERAAPPTPAVAVATSAAASIVPLNAAATAARKSQVAAVVATPPTQEGSSDGSGAAAEDRALRKAAQDLRDAVAHDPALAGIGGQMAIDLTRESLRIQIMDAAHQPMFDRGSAVPNPRAKALLRLAARFIASLSEPVSIGGYTDASPYRVGEPSNWTLSSDRANAARDILVGAGLPDARLANITGYADRKLLLPADPLAPANRRIVLTVRRTWPSRSEPATISGTP